MSSQFETFFLDGIFCRGGFNRKTVIKKNWTEALLQILDDQKYRE